MNHDYKQDNSPTISPKGCCGRGGSKLESYDWLSDLPATAQQNDYVEVQFKNTRKGYYYNEAGLPLKKGDMVAVEASPGHDIGRVSLTGSLVLRRMIALHIDPTQTEFKKIFRIAKPTDLEKYQEAKSREHTTMIESRKIASDLNLDMKIGDVEYQGDGNKAIFYYIADERVDFRNLIKVLAEVFRVRIEMKQIGARQEAGRIGGIGPCGRSLCCSSWMTGFRSVNTSAARIQDLTMNPQMLTGQCSKLKCCTNFEVNTYLEAKRKLPVSDRVLETEEGAYHLFKTDILAGLLTYSKEAHAPVDLVTISVARAVEIVELNKRNEKPASLAGEANTTVTIDSKDILEDNSLTRFDKKEKTNRNNRRRSSGKPQSKGQTSRHEDQRAEVKENGNTTHRKKERGERNNRNSQLGDKERKSVNKPQPREDSNNRRNHHSGRKQDRPASSGNKKQQGDRPEVK